MNSIHEIISIRWGGKSSKLSPKWFDRLTTRRATLSKVEVAIFLFVILMLPLSASAQSMGSFNKEVPYQQAVPSFLDKITQAIKNLVDPNVISPWIDQMNNRFSEFLDDLKQACIHFKDTTLELTEQGLDKLKEVMQKWDTLIYSLPGLNQFKQAVKPAADELVAGLPSPRRPREGDVPLQNIYEYYNTMERENPWGVGSFFHLEQNLDERIIDKIQEKLREQTVNGVQSTNILYKEQLIEKNGKPIFYLVIQDNQIIKKEEKPEDRTLIHQILREMKENNENPELIRQLEKLVALIDQNLDNPPVVTSSANSSLQGLNQGVMVPVNNISASTAVSQTKAIEIYRGGVAFKVYPSTKSLPVKK